VGTPVKLMLFGGVLVVVFGLGLMLGGIVTPAGPSQQDVRPGVSGQVMPGMNSGGGY
jgi:hypothetical protein